MVASENEFCKNPTSKNTITTIDSESYGSIGGNKHSLNQDSSLQNDNGIRTDFYWQWGFTGFDGFNGPAYKTTLAGGNSRYAWAVHDGDVGGTTILAGDMNFDSQVNIADYLLLTQFVLQIRLLPTAAELDAGDMNGNGQLDAGDLVIHSRIVMGQI